jgi:hypothetical protein
MLEAAGQMKQPTQADQLSSGLSKFIEEFAMKEQAIVRELVSVREGLYRLRGGLDGMNRPMPDMANTANIGLATNVLR